MIESRHESFSPGELVMSTVGWQEFALLDGASGVTKLDPRRPPTDYLSVLGGTGLTAYFGLLDVGSPRRDETVVISGAAGATGATAVQIARITGCRTIAIAGGPEKARWTVEELGAHAAIDYKNESVGDRLTALHSGKAPPRVHRMIERQTIVPTHYERYKRQVNVDMH